MNTTPIRKTVMYCCEDLDHKGELWKHNFYPHPRLVLMCGAKPDQIRKVEVTEDPAGGEEQYWGWWDAKKNCFVHVYLHRRILNMCFPYGMTAEEESGRGQGLPVLVQVIDGPYIIRP